MSNADRTDRAGAIAGTLCAAHCAISAFLPAAFGVLGLGFLLGHEAEWVLSSLAMLFATVALVLAWRARKDRRVAGLLALGIVGLLASRLVETAAGHGDHHGEAHAAEHGHEGHVEAGHDDGGAPWHLVGTGIGVLAGLTLVFGHVLNLRAQRAPRPCERPCDEVC
ncbi:MAG: MerC family mercury resistance protein [Nannocystaceae bacterium]|nr:MerC family mercury resistance protein [bacterium]